MDQSENPKIEDQSLITKNEEQTEIPKIDDQPKIKKVRKTEDMAKYKKGYNPTYYSNNKEYWKQKMVCEICGHEYARSNTYHHNASNKHLRALKVIN